MKTNDLRSIFAFGAVALFGCTNAASAQNTYFPNNATIDYSIDSAVVGYATETDYFNGKNGTSPTLSLLNGGSIHDFLTSYNNSTVSISGGVLDGYLNAQDSSTINISGGSLGNLNAYGNNTVKISGGTIGTLLATNGSTFNISGGVLSNLTVSNSRVNMSGGSVVSHSLSIYNGSTLNLFGTGLRAVPVAPNAYDSSTYALSGKLADGTDLLGCYLSVQNRSNTSFTLNDAPAVTGTLSLEGIAAPTVAQNVTFTFRPVDGGTILIQTVLVPASGDFRLRVPFNNYTVHIKGEKWLAQNVRVDVTNGDVSGVQVTLAAGDADNNNSVDIADFGLLVGAYGSRLNDPASGYDARADLNSDGGVEVADFALLVNNYGSLGDL